MSRGMTKRLQNFRAKLRTTNIAVYPRCTIFIQYDAKNFEEDMWKE
jgi:hypothetical protein